MHRKDDNRTATGMQTNAIVKSSRMDLAAKNPLIEIATSTNVDTMVAILRDRLHGALKSICCIDLSQARMLASIPNYAKL
jgi:hypothetical protein